ncbi:hypothetical protein PVAND_013766 [Polypedilum vanderplanki]|uniref:DUF753 domain-containing protein n=1 Tax=Polypedilum vanderplanki TaxID=319348 RepID=A0A9J6CSJ9_POLVA|nr:hypothetical protein PVAND_013766 [Polypedilum vanderplanki]
MWKKLIVLIYFCQSSFALQCYSCDSNYDPSCAFPMRNTSVILCEEEEDTECSTWIVGSNTFRGCASQKDENIQAFESCEGDLCNSNFYPKERLVCYSCSADNVNCVAPDETYTSPCRNYVENDKCFAYIINETSVIRGCMSDDNENVATCQSAGELCTKCSEGRCNYENGYSDIECISCSSIDNPACGYYMPLDRQFSTHVCVALVNRDNFCVSFKNGSTYYRGCLSDFESISVSSCLENDDCELCEEKFCNNKQIIKDECYECDSRIDNCENFESFQKSSTICKDVSIEKAGCFHFDNGNTIRRGCISSLSQAQFESCISDNSCKFCQGSKCNSKENFLSCYSCNSQNDLNCVTVKNELPRKVCSNYSDTCKVYVKPNMTTHRGCSSELLELNPPDCPIFSVNCKQCDESLCNGGIFPSTRLSCHHCQSSTDQNCNAEITDLSISYPCENYNFRDSCYLYLDVNNVTIRGCLSDSNIYTDLCTSNTSHCDICSTPNCNNKSVKRSPSLSCIKCDSSSDPKCLWGFSESSAMPCLRDLYFYEEESCFTFYVSEKTIIRQCTLDSNVCKNNPLCSLCKTNACNIEQKANLYCHECTSDENFACLNELEKVQNVSCQQPVTYENRGCYTWKNNSKNISRGCLSNLSTTKKFQCINDHENCEICVNGQNCNDKLFNGVKIAKFNELLFVILVIVLRNL